MIRRADLPDAPSITRLLVEVQDQHVAEHPAVFRTFGMEEADVHVVVGIEAGVYAVHDSGHIDGMMKWSVQSRGATLYTHAAQYVMVDEIAVAAQARRRGIAQRLLAWAIERAREAGASRVQIDTWSTNTTALAAFRKAGFTPYMHRQWQWLHSEGLAVPRT